MSDDNDVSVVSVSAISGLSSTTSSGPPCVTTTTTPAVHINPCSSECMFPVRSRVYVIRGLLLSMYSIRGPVDLSLCYQRVALINASNVEGWGLVAF